MSKTAYRSGYVVIQTLFDFEVNRRNKKTGFYTVVNVHFCFQQSRRELYILIIDDVTFNHVLNVFEPFFLFLRPLSSRNVLRAVSNRNVTIWLLICLFNFERERKAIGLMFIFILKLSERNGKNVYQWLVIIIKNRHRHAARL